VAGKGASVLEPGGQKEEEDYLEDGKGEDEKIFLRGKRSKNPAPTRRCQNLPQMSSI